MQTIEEYQRYTRQLEGEVKKWHDAFDASEVMNRELAAENKLGTGYVRNTTSSSNLNKNFATSSRT